ncbi:energy transducer TonB [Alistipes sp. ZOR0009]|uniref:energy transducer TonB n=1 Tax=Alistipes sp. ZOR0009 TaxID=1339253 RepID=UPI00068A3D34|nr:energy transducer TonB [Alistipes sp. ZOR0009]
MKKIITLMLCAFTISSFAQKIEYIDDDGIKTQKAKATSLLKIYTDSIRDKSILIKKYNLNEILLEEGYYKKNNHKIKHGETKEYYLNGAIKYKLNYNENRLDGEVFGYDSTGTLRRKDTYKLDSVVTGKCYTSTGKDTSYFPIIVYPRFNGEDRSKIQSFIRLKLEYPIEALQNKKQGVVFVRFTINKEGRVCNAKVVYSNTHSDLLDNEAIRVVNESSIFWEAGYVEGKKADISFAIPIKFQLN